MATTDGRAIPPIEIGSFLAPQADKSEFIGSASGIFFVNTVFRAFAAANSASLSPPVDEQSRQSMTQGGGGGGGISDGGGSGGGGQTPDVSQFGVSSTIRQDTDDLSQVRQYAKEQEASSEGSSFQYGVSVPGLGLAPDPAVAKELIMIYFREWHPFFPFLHGPSFLDQVNEFYSNSTRGDSDDQDLCAPHLDHRKTARAVIFQCIFNVAASSDKGGELLQKPGRIRSTFALTSLLGVVSSTNEMLSLQALMAMELYLVTSMSLRAASTVHGTLTRILFHSGFHRCPYRYVQLPTHMCEIRQRILWSAYILDRYLSQALGHPLGINDDEVDVCIPGLGELHQPIKPEERSQSVEPTAQEEARAHLPIGHALSGRTGESPATYVSLTPDGPTLRTNSQAYAALQQQKPGRSNDDALTCMITYNSLVGRALRLFHLAIHTRDITWDKVLSLSSEIHSWWNNLPLAFQDDEDSGAGTSHGSFFAIQYNYLLLFINRPFLSLPTNRSDFNSSLQTALNASRAIIRSMKRHQSGLSVLWPGCLTALWMSGLVVAFSGLLELYPLPKAESDIENCRRMLHSMGSRWPSANHCEKALRMLSEGLKNRKEGSQAKHLGALNPTFISEHVGDADSTNSRRSQTRAERPSNKRQRVEDAVVDPEPAASQTEQHAAMAESYLQQPNVWQPVLEYTGPDFGFDTAGFDASSSLDPHFSYSMGPEFTGLFNHDMWEAYIQGAGDFHNF